MNKQNLLAALAALLLVAAPAALPAQGTAPAAKDMESFTCDGAFFTALLPKGWQKHEAITEGRQNREFGVTLKGPKNADGAYLRISVLFYAADHARFKTADKYLNLNAYPDPTLKIKGETYGPVKAAVVAGRRGQQFERKTFDFIPPYGVKPKKVPVYEQRLVIPVKKGGFYVLSYHAPEDISAKNLPVFKEILKSFKPAQ